MECLRGPALQVVSGLQAHNAALTVEECLATLWQAFGPVESRKIAHVKFCKAYQEAGEKVSIFVLRLEHLLQRAEGEKTLLRRNENQGGATLTDKLQNRLMKQQRKPPRFLALVRLLHVEEDWETTFRPERGWSGQKQA